jgi:hypothetical protein
MGKQLQISLQEKCAVRITARGLLILCSLIGALIMAEMTAASNDASGLMRTAIATNDSK